MKKLLFISLILSLMSCSTQAKDIPSMDLTFQNVRISVYLISKGYHITTIKGYCNYQPEKFNMAVTCRESIYHYKKYNIPLHGSIRVITENIKGEPPIMPSQVKIGNGDYE